MQTKDKHKTDRLEITDHDPLGHVHLVQTVVWHFSEYTQDTGWTYFFKMQKKIPAKIDSISRFSQSSILCIFSRLAAKGTWNLKLG